MHQESIGKSDFTYKLVDSSEVLEEVFRLRYQVYCVECKFIKEEQYSEEKEQDKYDSHAVHFVAQDKYGVIGAARMILNSPLGFPLEEHCQGESGYEKQKIPREKLAEISRLVISKDYRRRREDGMYYTPEFDEKVDAIKPSPFRRIRSMTFGIYREIYQESKRRGITHWYALMETALWMLLDMNGFRFKPIGPDIEFFGTVKPYIGCIKEIEDSFSKKYPQFFEKFFLS